jgi:hypothetical protein
MSNIKNLTIPLYGFPKFFKSTNRNICNRVKGYKRCLVRNSSLNIWQTKQVIRRCTSSTRQNYLHFLSNTFKCFCSPKFLNCKTNLTQYISTNNMYIESITVNKSHQITLLKPQQIFTLLNKFSGCIVFNICYMQLSQNIKLVIITLKTDFCVC